MLPKAFELGRQKISSIVASVEARLTAQAGPSSSQHPLASQRDTDQSSESQYTACEYQNEPPGGAAPESAMNDEPKSYPIAQDGQRIHLCDLPADIRNLIYDFVCYHEGPISPASWKAPLHSFDTRDHFSRSALGQVQRLYNIKYHLDGRRELVIPGYIRPQPTRQAFRQSVNEWVASGGSLEDYVVVPNQNHHSRRKYEFLHICSSRCLLPPSLTQVNRQLREEVMSFFYGVNKFRFALGINENEAALVFLKWIRGLRKQAFLLIDHLELVKYHLRYGPGKDEDKDIIRITKDRNTNTQRWCVQLLYANEDPTRSGSNGPSPAKPRTTYRVLR